MKKMMIAFVMIFATGSAMAYGYDQYNAMADYQVAAVSAQERAAVMNELQEGDYREAQQVIQRDEAIKYQIRQNEAAYDQARNMNRYNYDYGYDDR